MRERAMKRILFLLPCIFFFLQGNSQDSCSSNLDLKELPTFNVTSLICLSVWDDQNFILRYKETTPGIRTFVLSTPNPNSWVGIGFSKSGRMGGASAMVGWVPAQGTGVMKQYYLNGYGAKDVLPDQGSLNLANSTIVSKSSRLYLAFQLKAGMLPSGVIYAIGPDGEIPSNFQLQEHVSFNPTNLDYRKGKLLGEGSSSILKTSHGVINLLGWGIILPTGILVARYCKRWDPAWFYTHIVLQVTGFSFAIVGIATGICLDHESASDLRLHKALGFTVLAMACLQVAALSVRPHKSSKVRKYWNWYHLWIGRLAIVIGIGNTFYGISLGGENISWNIGLCAVLILMGLTSMILERKFSRKDNDTPCENYDDDDDALI